MCKCAWVCWCPIPLCGVDLFLIKIMLIVSDGSLTVSCILNTKLVLTQNGKLQSDWLRHFVGQFWVSVNNWPIFGGYLLNHLYMCSSRSSGDYFHLLVWRVFPPMLVKKIPTIWTLVLHLSATFWSRCRWPFSVSFSICQPIFCGYLLHFVYA